MILSLCDNDAVLSVFRIISIVITIIKVVVPIILMLSLMINYLIAVKSEDYDALAKANKQMASKIIAAVLVFYIPTFVEVIADISSFDTDNYASCISNANAPYIEELVVSKARTYLGLAKKTLNRPHYNLAENMIKKVKDKSVKTDLETELADIEKQIEEKEAKEEAERQSHQQEHSSSNPSSPGTSSGSTPSYTPGVSGSVENVMGVYYYKQCDSRWGSIQYDTKGATLCSSACGYTSFAMIAAGLNHNTKIDPYTVIKDMRKISDGQMTSYGYGAASWTELTADKFISKYNLKSEYVDRTKIIDKLKEGKPVIALVPGHYIALSYSKNGNVVLLDPYVNWKDARKKSGEFKAVSDIEYIYGKISQAYAYSTTFSTK